MADNVGRENQYNSDSSDNQNGLNSIQDMKNTNSDGGRSIINILKNPNFKPSDLYFDASNINPQTGLPAEAGVIISNNYNIQSANDLYKKRLNNYDAFDDQEGSKDFVHNLDRGFIPGAITESDGRISYTNLNEIYLGSWYGTRYDNEDTIMFGYDIEIDLIKSPLFNGDLENFLNNPMYANVSEINSRIEILKDFKKHFFKFFKVNTTNDGTPIPNKVHYFKKISGLDKLVNRVTSDNFKGQFVEYWKDYIGLTIYEDVSLNLGYLASLYNSLSWSKINGKRIIPENLLRFDIKLSITEMRKFQRILKDNDYTYANVADNVSKHIYNIYECQFFFDKAYHNTDVDLSAPNQFNELEIKFNYKFYTHRFERFEFDATKGGVTTPKIINNLMKDPTNPFMVGELYTGRSNSEPIYDEVTGEMVEEELGEITIDASANTYRYKIIDKITKGSEDVSMLDLAAAVASGEMSAIEAMEYEAKRAAQAKGKSLFNKTVDELINAGKRELNRKINERVRLINDTIDKLLWSQIPGGMGISEPSNVYSNQTQFESDVKNALGNFVGQSIKNLLGK